MLMPGPAPSHIQYIDARDLAEWTLRMVSQQCPGTFNAVTPDLPGTCSIVTHEPSATIGALITTGARFARAAVHPVPMNEAWLLARGLTPWQDLPLWFPTQTTQEDGGYSTISPARAIEAGLTYRLLSHTVSDTLSWAKAVGMQLPLKAGLSREREAQILQAWEKEGEKNGG